MTGTDVLKEFINCECNDLCDCEVDARDAMADEIARLRAERDALRKLLRMCARTCDTLDHGPGKDFHESDEMCPIVVRITAALAVQPITGDTK